MASPATGGDPASGVDVQYSVQHRQQIAGWHHRRGARRGCCSNPSRAAWPHGCCRLCGRGARRGLFSSKPGGLATAQHSEKKQRRPSKPCGLATRLLPSLWPRGTPRTLFFQAGRLGHGSVFGNRCSVFGEEAAAAVQAVRLGHISNGTALPRRTCSLCRNFRRLIPTSPPALRRWQTAADFAILTALYENAHDQ